MSLTHSSGSSQHFFHPAVSLPREHLAAIQHIINDALALQARTVRPPPPPYNPTQSMERPQPVCFKPRMDIYESYDSSSSSGSRPLVTATFELPGLRKQDVHIDVLDNHMIVAGDRRQLPVPSELAGDEEMKDDEAPKDEERADSVMNNPQNRAGYTVREIKRGRFKRVVPLPAGTKLEDVKASMHDGILTVTFPGSVRPVPQSVPVA